MRCWPIQQEGWTHKLNQAGGGESRSPPVGQKNGNDNASWKVCIMNVVKPQYKWIVLAILAAIGGIYFTGLSGSYLLDYFKDASSNPNRNEYLEGVTLSLIFSLPFWLMLAAFATPQKNSLSKTVFILLRIPAMLLGFAFVLMNAYIFVMIFLDKFQGK